MDQLSLFDLNFDNSNILQKTKKNNQPEENQHIKHFEEFKTTNTKLIKTPIKHIPLDKLKIDYKNILNPSQFQGVTTTEGPVLLLAGAGSGKTWCLINRVAYLVEQGILPERILLLTFTNKAAKEMQDRASKTLDDRCKQVVASTYHSFFNTRVLRRFGQYVGLKPGYNVIEPADSQEIISMIKTDMDLKKDKSFPKNATVVSLFSMMVNKNYEMEECLNKEFDGQYTEYVDILEEILENFEKYKNEHNMIDFDDILTKSIELFEANESIRQYFENQYDYIMVDEYQDSNYLQDRLVSLMRQNNHNLAVVGDDSQCLIAGTEILTPNGKKKIEDIRPYDSLIVASGRGESQIALCNHMIINKYNGHVIKIETQSGKTITGTPEHIAFVNYMIPDVHYVILMYRKDIGYRLDVCASLSSDGKTIRNGYESKMLRNQADKIWILSICSSLARARNIMSYYSALYSIPTVPFVPMKGISPEETKNLHYMIDSNKCGQKLLNDMNMFFQYPHARINKTNPICNKKYIHATLFGSAKTTPSRDEFPQRHKSELSFSTSNKEMKDIVECTTKMKTCEKKRSQDDEMRYFGRKQYTSIDKMNEDIALITNEDNDISVIEEAMILNNKKKYKYMPLSHIKERMKVCIMDDDGTIKEEEVISVKTEQYNGLVYDIGVPEFRNYIAGDIIVHNCIYGFRGSVVENIIRFPETHENCKVIKLEQNYRSSQEIMDLSNSVMKLHCTEGIPKTLRATHENKKMPVLLRLGNESVTNNRIFEIIKNGLDNGKKLSDYAILSRSSTDTSGLEVLFTKYDIEYEKFGGLKFFDKEIVKDTLAFVRVLTNYRDEVSWNRILKLLPEIGDKTARRITPLCIKKGYHGLNDFKMSGKRGTVIISELHKLSKMIENLMKTDNPKTIMSRISKYYLPLKRKQYEEMNTTEDKRQEYLDKLKEGAEDIAFLIELSSQYNKMDSFVDDVILEKKTDGNKEKTDKEFITISTIHSAKGLEWDTVFVLNCVDGRFPKIFSWQIEDREKENNEELRCFYVAITRAKEHLYMTAPQMMRIGAGYSNTEISHFLDGSSHLYNLKRF